MATRLYLRDTPSYEAPTAGKKSTALPNAASTNGNSGNPFENRSLLLVKGETLPDSTMGITSLATTAHTDQYMGRFTSRKLAAQTITAQTWTAALVTLETNAGANSFHVLSVYIWRPSNSSVVGYIWDSHTTLGVEWIATLDGQVLTFAGAAVTAQLGDVLVMELWRHTPGQATGTAYLQQHNYNAYVDVTGGTVADPASYLEVPQNLVFDTPYLPAAIRGVVVETPGFAGPVIDGNGNLYVLLEQTELTPNPSIWKSANGGLTWTEQDAANKPTGSYSDLESSGLVISGTKIKFARMQSGASAVHLSYHEFNVSTSGTPDTWVAPAAIVNTAAGDPDQEQLTLIERSNGDLVLIYGEWVSAALSRIVYRKKPAAGAWSASSTLVFSGAIGSTAVLGAADKIHIFCKEDTSGQVGGSANQIVHLSLNSSDVLSSAEVVNDTAAQTMENMISRAVYFDDGGVESIYCVWAKSTGVLAGAFVLNDGTPSAEETVSDQIVWINPPDTAPRAPIATLTVDPATKTIYCAYSNNPSNNPSAQAPTSEGDLYLATRTHGVGWGTDVELRDGTRVQDIWSNVYTHSGANGGARVLGLFYDDANAPFYDEVVLAAGGPGPISAVLAQTEEVDAFVATGSTTRSAVLAQAEVADGFVATGSTTRSALLSQTEANDAFTAAASTTRSGTLAQAEAADGIVATASTTRSATLAQAEPDDSCLATASTTRFAVLAQAEAGDAFIGTAVLPIGAAIAQTEPADALAAAASTTRSAALVTVEESDGFFGGIGVLPVFPVVAVAEDDDTFVATASTTRAGVLAQAEPDDTVAATLFAEPLAGLSGVLAQTEEPDDLTAAVILGPALPIMAVLAIVEAPDGLASAGSILIHGILAALEADDQVFRRVSTGPSGKRIVHVAGEARHATVAGEDRTVAAPGRSVVAA